MSRLQRLRPYSSIPILMYHQVSATSAAEDPARLGVSPAQFEQHLAWLKERGYRSLSLTEAAQAWEKRDFIEKSLVITFDDGYLDNYSAAFPLLQKYGFSATIFVLTDFIGQASSRWGQGLPVKLMNWQQVREMRDEGIDFQSHGCTHQVLSQLSGEALRYELRHSKQKLEDELGQAVEHMAYPYGAYNDEVLVETEAAGYRAAYAAGLAHDGRFAVPRFCVGEQDGLRRMAFKIHPLANWLRGFDPFH